MRFARSFQGLLTFAVALLLPLRSPAAARSCCTTPNPDSLAAEGAARRPALVAAVPRAAWMFRSPIVAQLPQAAGSRHFDYLVEPHLWLMGGVQVLPTGVPLTAETSAAERTTYSQGGLGLGYMFSRRLRATSNWSTGLSRHSVTPGSQFTFGLAVRY